MHQLDSVERCGAPPSSNTLVSFLHQRGVILYTSLVPALQSAGPRRPPQETSLSVVHAHRQLLLLGEVRRRFPFLSSFFPTRVCVCICACACVLSYYTLAAEHSLMCPFCLEAIRSGGRGGGEGVIWKYSNAQPKKANTATVSRDTDFAIESCCGYRSSSRLPLC